MTLVATPATGSTSPFSGSRLLSDGQALSTAMKNGDWLDGGIAFFQGLGDLAQAMTDPIGAIVNCGLGWVMGHLGPLSTWLNQLMGSQSAVQSVSGAWTSVGNTMRTAGETFATRLKDLDGLKGSTVTAYLAYAKDAATHIGASGDWADAVSHGLSTASQLVAKMQGVVKQAISSVLSTAIEAMAVVAASWGLGIGYAIARVVTKVNQMVNKVAKPILQVLQSVKSLVGMVQQFHQLFDGTSALVSNMVTTTPQIADLGVSPIVDASGATFLGATGAANLQLGGESADGRIDGVITADGPIATGQVHLADTFGSGSGGAGAGGAFGAGGAGGAGGIAGAGALGGLGGGGAAHTAAVAGGGMLGGTALSAARVGGVSTGGAGGTGGANMVAGGRSGGAAEGMGSRSARRARRLTVDLIEDDDTDD